jgi:hypothetical protein
MKIPHIFISSEFHLLQFVFFLLHLSGSKFCQFLLEHGCSPVWPKGIGVGEVLELFFGDQALSIMSWALSRRASFCGLSFSMKLTVVRAWKE